MDVNQVQMRSRFDRADKSDCLNELTFNTHNRFYVKDALALLASKCRSPNLVSECQKTNSSLIDQPHLIGLFMWLIMFSMNWSLSWHDPVAVQFAHNDKPTGSRVLLVPGTSSENGRFWLFAYAMHIAHYASLSIYQHKNWT